MLPLSYYYYTHNSESHEFLTHTGRHWLHLGWATSVPPKFRRRITFIVITHYLLLFLKVLIRDAQMQFEMQGLQKLKCATCGTMFMSETETQTCPSCSEQSHGHYEHGAGGGCGCGH
jgi:hypothetical protein